jgi:hypothetical protein
VRPRRERHGGTDVQRDAEFARDQIAGSRRHDAERHLRVYQGVRHGRDCAVSADRHHAVNPFTHALPDLLRD